MHRRVRSEAHRGLRHRQARQPLRRRRRSRSGHRLSQGAGLRLHVAPMAASSRVNRTLDAEAARAITEIFTEVIIAPDATEEAIAISRKRRTCGCCSPAACPIRAAIGLTAKTVAGGLLVQSRDNAVVDDMTLKVGDQARADRRRTARSQIRVPRRQARQVEHHHLCQGSRHRRHRRRPDEPGRFRAHRRAQGAGCRGRTASSPNR